MKTQASPNFISNPQILLDLPPELTEPIKTNMVTTDIFNVNYKKVEDVPYGCLKNGKKKTYREWKEINNNNNNNNGNIDIHDIVRPPTPPKKNVNMFLEGGTPIHNTQTINTQTNNTQTINNTYLNTTTISISIGLSRSDAPPLYLIPFINFFNVS